MESGREETEFNPWRKLKIIQAIAAIDVVLATVSIFYNGKTLLVIFEGLHGEEEEEQDWAFIFLILSLTFSLQLLHIVMAMMLFKASSSDYSTLEQGLLITKVWRIVSLLFLIILVIEFYVGLRSFDYSNSNETPLSSLFFAFFILSKMLWRLFTLLYVGRFQKDIQKGLSSPTCLQQQNRRRPTRLNLSLRSMPPVFRMILTNPDNSDVDMSSAVAK